MATVVRIEPKVSEIVSCQRTLPIAEIHLGGVSRGAAIVLCRAGGLEHAAVDILNGLAEHGYESVAADLWPQRHSESDASVDDAALLKDVDALLGVLAGRGWSQEQIGIIGYARSGRLALLAAANFGMGAAVSVAAEGLDTDGMKSVRQLTDALGGIRTPWLGMFGEDDGSAHPATLARLSAALDAGSVFAQIVTYSGVSDDFYAGSRTWRGRAAEFDCWQRIVEWLNGRVVPRPTPYAEIWDLRKAK